MMDNVNAAYINLELTKMSQVIVKDNFEETEYFNNCGRRG